MDWMTVAGGLLAFGWTAIAVYVARSIKELTDSVSELNVKIAVILERTDGHERRITRLEGDR